MEAWVSSGRIVDLVLIFVVIEAALLTVYRTRSRRGLGVADIFLMLLPGVCLLLALRAALVNAAPVAVLLLLTLALCAHLADLWRREKSLKSSSK